MILRAAENAVISRLKLALEEFLGGTDLIDIYNSDEDERKRPMPYIIAQCSESEETITPGSGIFKVTGMIEYRSHTKETTQGERQKVLNAINQFAYNSPAAKLSMALDFHCHGFQPLDAKLTLDQERKATIYQLTYAIYCMELDESSDPPL